MKKNALIITTSLIVCQGMIPEALGMEDGLSPPGAQQSAAKAKPKKNLESNRAGKASDDQALGGHKQESLRPPATPNGLVNPCQMADSPKWCDGQ